MIYQVEVDYETTYMGGTNVYSNGLAGSPGEILFEAQDFDEAQTAAHQWADKCLERAKSGYPNARILELRVYPYHIAKCVNGEIATRRADAPVYSWVKRSKS